MNTAKPMLTTCFNCIHEIHASYYAALAEGFDGLRATLTPRMIAAPSHGRFLREYREHR